MIITRTPFRVSFFGGGTDFPEFYAEHGGACLLTSIDQYCYIVIHRLSPFFKYRFRASYARTELVQDPSEFQHPLIRESFLKLGVSEGLEMAHVSDLPGRTGLGTSSSFTVGLLHALHTYRNDRVSAEDLAREAIDVERARVGDSGGHQDQYAAAYGGFMRLNFSAGQHVEVRELGLPAERLRALEDHLMLFYTGMECSAETVANEQKERMRENTGALKEMLLMVDEAERVLASDSDLAPFGDLLHETWIRKKSLSTGISNSDVDQAYEAGRSAGARGGKLLGAGGRGFLLLYVEPGRQDAVRGSLSGLQEVNFGFGDAGSEVIFNAAQRE